MPSNYDKLLQYALRIIAKKRYTVSEMRCKLTSYARKYRSLEEDNIEPVIERLTDLKYLDDERFIRDYIAERMRFRPRGRRLLMKELMFKGISKDSIESALEKLDIDESEIALELLTKKMGGWCKFPIPKQKIKAFQLLFSRGFERDAIYKVIESCYNISAD